LQGKRGLTDLVALAAAFRAEQRMEEALDTIQQAVSQNPQDARALFGLAQISFESWRPAADLFGAARRLYPDNPDLIRNHALALAAEGDRTAAEMLLIEVLRHQPLWIEGHRTLASLRVTHDEVAHADESYAVAFASTGPSTALAMAWFQHHATLKQWDAARDVIETITRGLTDNRQLAMATLFLDSEGTAATNLAPRFAAFDGMRDPGIDLCHVRYLLRTGEYRAAEGVASRHIATPAARMFWPYLSLCWRLTGDQRAEWLDGKPIYHAVTQHHISARELSALAGILHDLHRLKAPYAEQSVRGGTQTDRQLFFHPDPAIQSLRIKVQAAVLAYRADLPVLDADHPLARSDGANVLFDGSWSVLLRGGGHHVPHTHVHGCISSAFYVAVPPQAEMGVAPAGGLSLGKPPSELGLTLPAYATVMPTAGQLVLFPSTMWHGTHAIESGERLTVAFDVKL
jgi:hypothetical protein